MGGGGGLGFIERGRGLESMIVGWLRVHHHLLNHSVPQILIKTHLVGINLP